jgi:hypothetical protein
MNNVRARNAKDYGTRNARNTQIGGVGVVGGVGVPRLYKVFQAGVVRVGERSLSRCVGIFNPHHRRGFSTRIVVGGGQPASNCNKKKQTKNKQTPKKPK